MPLDSRARGEIDYVVGEINPREDRDLYRLELATRSELVVDVEAGFRARARILDKDGGEVDAENPLEDYALERVMTQACDDWTMKLVESDSGSDALQLRFKA